ncbi:MAG: type III-B CRISPR module-associated Cmr3 family protein, partial [Chloracidobacterium sp.]
MALWMIEPRDPIIFRDGRPFGAWGGARATSLPFPFPSTIAGGVRTRAFRTAQGVFDPSAFGRTPAEARALSIRGPFLVELDASDAIQQWLWPAPLDALVLRGLAAGDFDVKRLVPLALPPGVTVGLPVDGLCPVGLAVRVKAKPAGDAPAYWYGSVVERWLTRSDDWTTTAKALGHGGPVLEQRTHVALDPATLTAEDGRLFQTSGLAFTCRVDGEPPRRLALAVWVADDAPLQPGLAPLGGERRLVMWRPSKSALPPCPAAVHQAVCRQGACRLILATP